MVIERIGIRKLKEDNYRNYCEYMESHNLDRNFNPVQKPGKNPKKKHVPQSEKNKAFEKNKARKGISVPFPGKKIEVMFLTDGKKVRAEYFERDKEGLIAKAVSDWMKENKQNSVEFHDK